VLSIVQFVFPNRHVFLTGGASVVTPEPGGFTRIRPPGLVLVYIGLIFVAAYLIWGPRRARKSAMALAAVLGIGILLSLNRNMIIGLPLGLIAALIASRQRRRAAVLLGGAAIVAVAALNFIGSGAIAARILSLGSPTGLEKSSSLSDRRYEDHLAVAAIKRHPIFGIGWGVSYGAVFAEPSGQLVDRPFVHNQYYELWLKTGIFGLLAYLGLLGTSATYAIRWLRRRADAPDGWLGQAVFASVVAFAASSIVGIYVIDAGSTPAVAALFAVAAFLHERIGRDGCVFAPRLSRES
jgi:O-antigen ligase